MTDELEAVHLSMHLSKQLIVPPLTVAESKAELQRISEISQNILICDYVLIIELDLTPFCMDRLACHLPMLAHATCQLDVSTNPSLRGSTRPFTIPDRRQGTTCSFK